jgi:rhamnosyltransferase
MVKIAVLMASYNGLAWLPEQLDSILNQQNIDVSLYISDDFSQDGSYEYLQQRSAQDGRVQLLPLTNKFGSAGRNFYRLIQDVDVSDYDYIAYADQDDIWDLDKLIRHVKLIQLHRLDGVSSNVMAFWPNGKQKLINKSKPQREFDYLFESAGPGCTFLMTPWLVAKLKYLLTAPFSIAREVALHDWLAYAVCRASGRKWLIDEIPTVQYRQHMSNVLGANSGVSAKINRIKMISEGWYRQEVLKIINVCLTLSSNNSFSHLREYLTNLSFKTRFSLLSFVGEARRSFTDRIFFAISILVGLF